MRKDNEKTSIYAASTLKESNMAIYAVTGAASGIGKAIKEQLQSKGHEVITIDIRDADIVADLSDSDQCQAAIEAIVQRAPDGLDGLVPCAGVAPGVNNIELIPLVNYFSIVDLVNGLLPALKQKRGAVVLISSNSSQMMEYNEDYIQALLSDNREEANKIVHTIDGLAAYGGGKQALVRWMRHNNQAFAQAGVRMNAIAPGYTETAMTAAGLENPLHEGALKKFAESIPVGRPGLPEDQANAVTFLLSESASFISGTVLFVDGGHDAVFRPDKY